MDVQRGVVGHSVREKFVCLYIEEDIWEVSFYQACVNSNRQSFRSEEQSNLFPYSIHSWSIKTQQAYKPLPHQNSPYPHQIKDFLQCQI